MKPFVISLLAFSLPVWAQLQSLVVKVTAPTPEQERALDKIFAEDDSEDNFYLPTEKGIYAIYFWNLTETQQNLLENIKPNECVELRDQAENLAHFVAGPSVSVKKADCRR